jgi:hypothetical protein
MEKNHCSLLPYLQFDNNERKTVSVFLFLRRRLVEIDKNGSSSPYLQFDNNERKLVSAFLSFYAKGYVPGGHRLPADPDGAAADFSLPHPG